jgi:hypothetical protein
VEKTVERPRPEPGGQHRTWGEVWAGKCWAEACHKATWQELYTSCYLHLHSPACGSPLLHCIEEDGETQSMGGQGDHVASKQWSWSVSISACCVLFIIWDKLLVWDRWEPSNRLKSLGSYEEYRRYTFKRLWGCKLMSKEASKCKLCTDTER